MGSWFQTLERLLQRTPFISQDISPLSGFTAVSFGESAALAQTNYHWCYQRI